MPGSYFYVFIGFITAIMADYEKQIGPIIYVFLLAFNAAAIGMYLYARRQVALAGPAEIARPVAVNFLLLAPLCYALGLFLGYGMRVY
jgi:hypothetical protein